MCKIYPKTHKKKRRLIVMKKEMNNKGFSLVELIIVIAIMAVLIGVLAPQYLKYVKQSKISTDITNAEEVASAVNVGIADPLIGTAGINTAIASGAGVGTNVYTSAAVTASGASDIQLPDSKLNPGSQWVVTYSDSGVSSITLNGTDIWPDAGAYEDL
jgi:type IV pilus assembly protein PilA